MEQLQESSLVTVYVGFAALYPPLLYRVNPTKTSARFINELYVRLIADISSPSYSEGIYWFRD